MKKGQVPAWVLALLIAIVACLIVLFIYMNWKTQSVGGVDFIKSLFGEI